MRKIILSNIVFLFLSNLCFSHKVVPDSLIIKLEQAGPEGKVSVLLQVADLLVDSAIYHDQAKEYLTQAYTVSKEYGDTIQQIKVLNYFGLNEFSIGNYEFATDYFYQSMKLAELISDSGFIAVLNHNLGMIYDEMEEYDDAIDFYKRSLAYDELRNDTLGIVRCYINLSISYQNKEDLNKAQEYCENAFELIKLKNDTILRVTIINNLGTIAYDKKEYDKSLEYYQQALHIYEQLSDKDGISTAYNNIGLVYLDTKDYSKAKHFFYKALKLAEELNLYDFSGDIFNNLKYYYEETGDYKNALYYYEKYNEVYDSLIGDKKNKQIRQLQAKFESEKKQNQILQLEKKTASQQTVIKNARLVQVYLIIITCIVVILLFIVIYMLRKEKKLIVELREKSDKLKTLNASKDKFFSIIAHDLRNPFHALFSYTNLLKEGLDNFSKEEVTEILSDLHDATDQGFNLLQNLLFWTRSQSNRLHVFETVFEMGPLAEEVINLARPNANKKEQQLVISVEGDCKVSADKDMISTIVRNLIFNAIKFSNKKNVIHVEISCVGKEVHLKVIDHGVGMDEDQIQKLFVIDEHMSSIGTAGELGSGLGLILCNEFAAKNNGRIQVESMPGVGSVFTLILPCI